MLASTKREKLLKPILEEIKKSKKKLYLCITGGGTAAIPMLLENGGASSYFIGASVPYDTEDLHEIVGSFDKAVSEHVANVMTTAGYHKFSASKMVDGIKGVCVSCTCSLAKNGVEREDREHVAYLSVSEYDDGKNYLRWSLKLNLKKGRTRKEEEDLLAAVIVCLAFNMCGDTKWNIGSYDKAYEMLGLTTEEITFTVLKKEKEKKNEEKESVPSEQSEES